MSGVSQPHEVIPLWWQEFRRLFEAGLAHCFLISGDIHGVTAFHGLSQQVFLTGALAETREVVAQYHPATGITFALPSMRTAALAILGPKWQPPTTTDDRYAAALDAAGYAATTEDVFASARHPAKALAILSDLLHAPAAARLETLDDGSTQISGRIAVVLDQADLILPATGKAQMNDDRLALLATLLSWGHDPVLARQQNPVLLLSSLVGEVHPDLLESASGYRLIEQSLPDEATRLAYLTWYLEEHRREAPIQLIDFTKEDLARRTAGLDLRQVEDVLLAGASRSGAQQRNGVSQRHIKERKDALIRQQFSDVIEMLDPLPGGFSALGGMHIFQDWFRHEVMAPLREGRLHDVPKGLLLVGPPGTGKTQVVSAAATELGYNAIQIHMANVLGGIVGTSERNLQKIFRLARDLAPTFLFIDEIDQSLLASRGDASGSPVASNLFGAMLQFLGDESLRGKVIVVGATNQPGRLDPALRRFGRFEVTFPLLSPEHDARLEILAIQASRQRVRLAPEALTLLAEETERYSAADLAELVREARLLATLASAPTVGLPEARGALDNVRPVTLASVETYTRAAIDACSNLRYLPPAVADAERARLAAARSPSPSTSQPVPSARGARHL